MRHIIADAAKFFRRLSGASPKRVVQKVVIHLGMPKAGSTSIQLALHAAQDSILTPNRIWFTPPEDAFNDCAIYDMLGTNDLQALRQYAEVKIRAAAGAGADVIIFSAERLFTIDEVKTRIAQLAKVMRPWAAEVSFVVVAREIRSFLRSYITQMIYNADITLDDHGLAEWVIDQIGLISESGFPVVLLPLDDHGGERNIAERLVSACTGRELDIPLSRANVTPSRPLVYALAEGLVARIRAIETGGDINATELDSFRTAFATAYDSSIHGTSDPGEVYQVLQRLNGPIEEQIAEYIAYCLQECPIEKLAFYDEILMSGPNRQAIDRDAAVKSTPSVLDCETLDSGHQSGHDGDLQVSELIPRRRRA